MKSLTNKSITIDLFDLFYHSVNLVTSQMATPLHHTPKEEFLRKMGVLLGNDIIYATEYIWKDLWKYNRKIYLCEKMDLASYGSEDLVKDFMTKKKIDDIIFDFEWRHIDNFDLGTIITEKLSLFPARFSTRVKFSFRIGKYPECPDHSKENTWCVILEHSKKYRKLYSSQMLSDLDFQVYRYIHKPSEKALGFHHTYFIDH